MVVKVIALFSRGTAFVFTKSCLKKRLEIYILILDNLTMLVVKSKTRHKRDLGKRGVRCGIYMFK